MSKNIHIQSAFVAPCLLEAATCWELLLAATTAGLAGFPINWFADIGPGIPAAATAVLIFAGIFFAGEYTAGDNWVVDSRASVAVTEGGRNDLGVGGRVLLTHGAGELVGLCAGDRVAIGAGAGVLRGGAGAWTFVCTLNGLNGGLGAVVEV